MRTLIPVIVVLSFVSAAQAEDKPSDAAWLVEIEVEPARLVVTLPLVAAGCSEAAASRDGSGYNVRVCDQSREGRPMIFLEMSRSLKERNEMRLKAAVRFAPGKKILIGRIDGPDGAARVNATVSAAGAAGS